MDHFDVGAHFLDEEVLRILRAVRPYIDRAAGNAEARHDDPDSGMYTEFSQYEIMQEGRQILRDIDAAVERLMQERFGGNQQRETKE